MARVVDTDIFSFLLKKDTTIAATAISLQIPLVTNNEKDFQKIKALTIISEK